MQRPMNPDAGEQQMAQLADVGFGRRSVDGAQAQALYHSAPDRQAAEQRVGEQRTTPRRRVLLSGLIVSSDSAACFAAACTTFPMAALA